MGIIEGWAISSIAKWAIGIVGGLVGAWILAKIPTGKWAKQSGEAGQGHGKIVTKFCSEKIPFWNKLIEPVFIDSIGVILSWFSGFIIGLKSDN